MKINPLITSFLGHAGILAGIGCFFLLLPSGSELDRIATTAESASGSAVDQLALLRAGIDDLQRPEIQASIDHASQQANAIAEVLKGQSIDIETVQVLHDALGDLADGLEKTGDFVDAENALAMATALESTADFLEISVAANADQVANQIETVASAFSRNAELMKQFLEKEPFDLRAVEQLRDTLDSYSEALKKGR